MIKKLFDGIYLFRFKEFGSHVYFFSDLRLLIDTSSLFNREELLFDLKTLGFVADDINYVFNTHLHYDHFQNNALFSNAKIFVSSESKRLYEHKEFHFVLRGSSEDMFIPKMDIYDVINPGDDFLGFKIVDGSGHIPGQISFYLPDYKLLISGDFIFADGVFGRLDLPFNSKSDMIRNLRLLRYMDIDIIAPGHGRISYKGNIDVEKAIESFYLFYGRDFDKF